VTVNRKTVFFLVLLLLASNLITFWVTGNYYCTAEQEAEQLPEPAAVEPEIPEDLKPFLEVLEILSERYIDKVSREDLINEAINGMVGSLNDPQTSFFEASDWEEMMIKIEGSFSGIGVNIISVDNYITVVSPIKNTPGEQAGFLPGDRIIAVDGVNIVGKTTTEAVSLMRGPEGTPVTLTVERNGFPEPLTITVVRENIEMPSVFPEMDEQGIGYIQITSFSENTGNNFREALLELEAQNMRGLILDLRDNPGGLLNEAIIVGQEIIPPGIITRTVDGEGNVLQNYLSYGTEKEYPIVVLVNGFSASAAEIISGALHDTGAGVLVGTKTYGKATVQHLERIAGNRGLSYTVAKYQTPKGRDIHGNGLEPDYYVELPTDIYFVRYQLFNDLSAGDEGATVLILQKKLKAMKYDVEETAIFDRQTEKALRTFQESYGLPVTGQLDQATRTVLSRVMEDVADDLDKQLQKARTVILEMLN
jgi:carboxyl-terminal processing protease